MKSILINSIVMILIFQNYCNAQNEVTQEKKDSWSIGTILFSEQNRREIETYSPIFFSGIIIKKKYKKFIYRTGIEYKNIIDKSNEPNFPDMLYTEGYVQEGMLRLGIEKDLIIKKNYIPYFTIDFIGLKSFSDINESGGFGGGAYNKKTKKLGLGLAPTLGFEFKFTNCLSIAIETRFRFMYMRYKIESINLYRYSDHFTFKNEEFNITYNRISALTLNYNF